MLDRNNPSRAWKHFNKISSTTAECIHCGLIILRKKSSTSKLLAHITRHHSQHDSEEVYPNTPHPCLNHRFHFSVF